MITMKEEVNLYLDLERMSANREGTISHRFANEITTKYPQVRINNVYSKIGELSEGTEREGFEPSVNKSLHSSSNATP